MAAYRAAAGMPAANTDAAFHDLHSALKVFEQVKHLPCEQIHSLVCSAEQYPGGVGAMTVNQLIALIQGAQGGGK